MDLDAVDKRILRAIQKNCVIGADALAEIGGVSASTALRRMKRLRDLGVIREEVAVVEPKKVGRPLQMIIGLRLERDNAQVAGAFVRAMREHPAVMQCFFVTGGADYILHLSAADMDEFDAFLQMQIVANPHVAVTETNVVISAHKVGLKVPID